ncbi:MAG: ribosomal protein L11 methylase PrmA [Candidatus Aldehydirespiratoraceae bacterium]
MTDSSNYDSGSFRDPSSRVWREGELIRRGLDEVAAVDFDLVEQAKFFTKAIKAGQIVGTQRCEGTSPDGRSWTTVLEHDRIPVITYPHEWSFTMLQDAALLTLRLVRAAIDENITTKDATAYNVQFVGASPVFIDVPSFEKYRQGEAWWGYRQFCQMFLFPLMFTAYKDLPHQPWMRGAVDGITPEQARRILEGRRAGHKGFLSHVWLHAKADSRFKGGSADTVDEMKKAGYKKELYVATIDRLIKLVEGLEWERSESTWGDYSQRGHYESKELLLKSDFVRRVAAQGSRSQVWDVGANDGMFSRIAAEHADVVLAMDADDLVVDRLYRELRSDGTTGIVPMVMNFADPTPGIGWNGTERPPLPDRSSPDLILALAVIHHLALTHNVPTSAILDLFVRLGSEVVLEVPTENDQMVKTLMRHKRAGTHDAFTLEAIEAQINERFEVREREELPGGTRVLFHLAPK